jgi:hypothetical protein
MGTVQSRAEKKLLDLMNDKRLGGIFGATMAEIAVELMDAKMEAKHWKACLDACRAEIKVLAAVALAQLHQERLVITRKELGSIPKNTKLFVGNPEPDVRIYELRRETDHVDEPETVIFMNS